MRDVTLVGNHNFNDGLGKVLRGFVDCLSGEVSMNCISATDHIADKISPELWKILSEPPQPAGKIAIQTNLIWLPYTWHLKYQKVPEESHIKIAYSMFEASRIPQEWTDILNEKFDALVVPDPFCVEIYRQSGVKCPIFMLPMSIDYSDFLACPSKEKTGRVFTFGNCSAFIERKNHETLIRGFAKAFKNHPSIKLKINGRYDKTIYPLLLDCIEELEIDNVELSVNMLSWKEYVSFISSFDCYACVSKGEGFSIPPREALACGLPCLLSNNSALKTICETGFVRAVPSNIAKPAWNEQLLQCVGEWPNCDVDDVAKAFIDVYENYPAYLAKARSGREWVQANLKRRYVNLVKPSRLILGDRDELTDDYLMTASKELYRKYSLLG